MHDRVLRNIEQHILLDNEEKIYFISLLKHENIARRELVLKEGQLCKYISFVNDGLLRAYCIDKENKEATIMFAVSGWWITDMPCFINEKPAMMVIEAVENSNILQLQKSDLDKLYIKIPKFERFFRIIMQNAYIREQLRVMQNLTLSAAERYEHFLVKYPQISAQVTQKQIASYLGITPEFLSTLRANKIKKTIS